MTDMLLNVGVSTDMMAIVIIMATAFPLKHRVYMVFDNVPKSEALVGKLLELHAAVATSGVDPSVLPGLVQWCVGKRVCHTDLVD